MNVKKYGSRDSKLEEFDEAALEAANSLLSHDPAFLTSVEEVAKWWQMFYLGAGHKRLGRLLVAIADKGVVDGIKFFREQLTNKPKKTEEE